LRAARFQPFLYFGFGRLKPCAIDSQLVGGPHQICYGARFGFPELFAWGIVIDNEDEALIRVHHAGSTGNVK
jgi:hypothetical protein